MKRKLRVLDLFSGIGGFSLGLERTGGFETVAFCEIDRYCRAVLKKHWPHVPCDTDITQREFVEGEADVICGGFPCQDISVAGAGAGITGSRSGLYREAIRAIRLVRPLYAALENVAALLGRGMDVVLGDLAEIGYDAEWHCIPASAVGAPHRRDRVWIIANAGSEQHKSDRAPFSGTLAKELSASYSNANVYAGELDARTDCEAAGGSEGGNACEGQAPYGQWLWSESGPSDKTLANTSREHECGCGCGTKFAGRRELANGCEDVADAAATQRERDERTLGIGAQHTDTRRPGWWAVEPNVGRVAHGISSRVDRLRALGNAVVPQIPEIIGHAILSAEAA